MRPYKIKIINKNSQILVMKYFLQSGKRFIIEKYTNILLLVFIFIPNIISRNGLV